MVVTLQKWDACHDRLVTVKALKREPNQNLKWISPATKFHFVLGLRTRAERNARFAQRTRHRRGNRSGAG